MAGEGLRARAIDALMALAAEKDFARIELSDVAARAGMGAADLRREFEGTLDILAAFSQRIDEQVLAGTGEDMDGEPARERLFDVVMRRFDHLRPHREGLRSVLRALSRDPVMLARWNRTALITATWMLNAARIDATGLSGAARAQGLAIAFGRVMRTFLDDDDPGMARTMSELDRRLREGERALGLASRLARFACGPLRGRKTAAARSPA